MREFEDLMDSSVHWYPNDPRYRRSGNEHPQVGDVALCGHVKKLPPANMDGARLTCANCATLRAVK
jgi:hypothetical protein